MSAPIMIPIKQSDYVQTPVKREGLVGKNSTVYCGELTKMASTTLRLSTFDDEDDLVASRLVDPDIIFNAEEGLVLDYGSKFHFETRSKHKGGLGKCECGFDPSEVTYIPFERKLKGV